MNFKEDFKKVIEEKKIVLFMKGTKDAPSLWFF
jgi:Glutaredoxin-related protein